MKKVRETLIALLGVLILLQGLAGSTLCTAQSLTAGDPFKYGVELFDKGMFSEAKLIFDGIREDEAFDTDRTVSALAQGYSVLCAVNMKSPGYETLLEAFLDRGEHTGLEPRIRYRYGLNLFDQESYDKALVQFKNFSVSDLEPADKAEYTFKSAYCNFSLENYDSALQGFSRVINMPTSDYTAPSQYASGYIHYERQDFPKALSWFEQSVLDPRFEAISNYYIAECHFMDKDYEYVSRFGPGMLNKVPEDRKGHLARLISESFLVRGDAEAAKEYYDMIVDSSEKGRGDYFYAGSLMYAIKDWQGAIDNYGRMGERTDSLGQLANYNMAYAYIQTKNKVAAMDTFKDAASVAFDPVIQEDAFFNWAKLSFDLNNDGSVFEQYLSKYADKAKGESIYTYMALAALYNHDYAGAVEAYDNIDELDDDMKGNYMKANYLRANQLIRNSSWRSAIDNLRAAAFYADKMSDFYQLDRYWLGEAYYNDEQYTQAKEVFTDLYNQSGLDGKPEGAMLPYNIAYCYFQEGAWEPAYKWFTRYAADASAPHRRDAMVRAADAKFISKEYEEAVGEYGKVIRSYPALDDMYPYYRSGVSYGLLAENVGTKTAKARRERTALINKRIDILSKVDGADPSVPYYNDALYELAQTYLDNKQSDKASSSYRKLIGTSRDSSFTARGLMGLGLIARNNKKYDESLDYYKRVVKSMPSSQYADDALLAIESLYQAKKQPDKYYDYLQTLGGRTPAEAGDRENAVFSAAEQNYLAGNYSKAVTSLLSYLQDYPSGYNRHQAEFYLADSYRSLDKKDQACDYYRKVMEGGEESSFAEVSALQYATLTYSMEKYDEAFEGYSTLAKVAKMAENVKVAKVGLVRSAFGAKKYAEAIRFADEVLLDASLSADDKREAEFLKARSYLASSDRSNAMTILRKLARATNTVEGAQSTIMLIQDSYDKGDFKSVEDQVYSFAESGTSQMYYLAKAFIILGDTFVEREEYEQAKATFESVIDGYKPSSENDDTIQSVKMRLNRLAELTK